MYTPFGNVIVLLDDKPVAYSIIEKDKKIYFPDVLGCYRITVNFTPDGKEHEIKCVIQDMKYNDKGPESGEDIECQSFYNDKGEKISICVRCETGYLPDGKRWSDKYDYDANYLENGMSYKILKDTTEDKYIFGIAWINNVKDEFGILDNSRDIQPWLAADITID